MKQELSEEDKKLKRKVSYQINKACISLDKNWSDWYKEFVDVNDFHFKVLEEKKAKTKKADYVLWISEEFNSKERDLFVGLGVTIKESYKEGINFVEECWKRQVNKRKKLNKVER